MRQCTLLILTVVILALTPGPALPQEDDSPYIIITPDSQHRAWSQTQFDNVQPLDMPRLSQEEFDRQFKGRTIAPLAGEPMREAPVTETPGLPSPADITILPYSPCGKLFFTTPNGDASCSAEFVGDSGQVFMTAAHCVVDKDTGKPYTNFTFYRAWSGGGGSQTHIKFGALYKKWKPGKEQKPNPAYDYAFFFAQVKSSGGSQGLRMDMPEALITAMGYPINYGNAQYLYKVDGSRGTVFDGIVQMTDNPMIHGSSGGAWICRVTGQDYAVGLNSFSLNPASKQVYSPLFNNDTWSLYLLVKKGTLPQSH